MEVGALLPQEEFHQPLQTQVARLHITIVLGDGMRKIHQHLVGLVPPQMEVAHTVTVAIADRPTMDLAVAQIHVHLVHLITVEVVHPEVHSIQEVAIQEVEAAVEVVVQVAEVLDHHLQDLGHRAETTKFDIHFG